MNDARGVDHADTMVVRICDVDVAHGIHRHSAGFAQQSTDGRAAVPVKTTLSRARDSMNDSRGVDHADTMVVRICDVDVAHDVHNHPFRESQQGAVSWSAIPVETIVFRARKGADGS